MFLYELFNKTAKMGLPFIAKIALTPECNLSCRHCYVGRQQGRILETYEFKEIINQLAGSGVLFLTLTGGEPMMHPGFWDIVEFARKCKFYLRIFTNGTFIDEKAAEQLAGYGVNEVYVSLYGHEQDIHELVTGGGGSFDKTVNSIKLLKRRGVEVQVKSSAMTLNRDYLIEIEKFCHKMGVNCNISYILSPKTDGNEEPCLLQYPDGLESEAFFGRPPDSPATSEGNIHSLCPAGENSFFIEYDGTLYPCVNYRHSCGNLTKTPFTQLWNSNEMIEVRTGKATPGQCASCGAINSCMRCPGLSYHEAGRKNGYSQIQCRQTRLLVNMKERSGVSGNERIC